MSDTPIYDKLVYERDNPDWAVNSYVKNMLDSYLSVESEIIVLKRHKGPGSIYQYQLNELTTRRRYDRDYHSQFKREYGRKVYKSVVDWKL